ncbi:MAG: preprotein translocase subunit YajC [Pseudomonadota bacterium]
MDFLINAAWAQDGATGPSPMGTLLFPLILIAVFYFLLIRPQQKRAKEHRLMVEGLSAGDEIVTNGGVLGKVTEVGEQFLTVEISPSQNIKLQRNAVAAIVPKGTVKQA